VQLGTGALNVVPNLIALVVIGGVITALLKLNRSLFQGD